MGTLFSLLSDYSSNKGIWHPGHTASLFGEMMKREVLVLGPALLCRWEECLLLNFCFPLADLKSYNHIQIKHENANHRPVQLLPIPWAIFLLQLMLSSTKMTARYSLYVFPPLLFNNHKSWEKCTSFVLLDNFVNFSIQPVKGQSGKLTFSN